MDSLNVAEKQKSKIKSFEYRRTRVHDQTKSFISEIGSWAASLNRRHLFKSQQFLSVYFNFSLGKYQFSLSFHAAGGVQPNINMFMLREILLFKQLYSLYNLCYILW